MFNVDWLTMVQQFPIGDYPDYHGGHVVSVQGSDISTIKNVDSDGVVTDHLSLGDVSDIDFKIEKFSRHQGSFETSIEVRFVAGLLEVKGNPSSYGRLDNVFGVTLDQGVSIYNSILRSLGLPEFSVGVIEKIWLQHDQKFVETYTGARIRRIDYCRNLSVGCGNVRKFHKWLSGQKLYRSSPSDELLDKQASKWDFSTVYLSESVYWMNAKVYDKGENLEQVVLPNYRKKLSTAVAERRITKKDFNIMYNEAEEYLINLACWCAEVGLSRIEYSLKSRWFKQHDEGRLAYWKPLDTDRKLLEIAEKEFEKIGSRAMVIQNVNMDTLTNSEFRAYSLWKSGEPVRDFFPDRTFYRLKSSILKKTGYDLGARPVSISKDPETRFVYFKMKPLSVSDAPSFYRASDQAA